MKQTIETERLILRNFHLSDAQAMFDHWASDDEATKFLTWQPHQSVDTVIEHLEAILNQDQANGYFHWAIVEKSSNQLIGRIDIIDCNEAIKMKEIGYVLGKKWWHMGYMSEALNAVIAFLFTKTDTNRIEATHDEENRFSGAVMSKAGMLFEGVHQDRSRNNRGIVNQVMYGITKKQYLLRDISG
jgi:ribosomal-protein-alanine N-acetyltransferase